MQFFVSTRILKCIRLLECVKTYHTRHFCRVITRDKERSVLGKDTLTGRILTFLNSDTHKPKQNIINTLKKINSSKVIDLSFSSTEEILNIIYSLNGDRYFTKNADFSRIFRALDNECTMRYQKLDTKSIFNILNAYVQLLPNRILETRFYDVAINNLLLQIHTLDKSETVNLIFYIGLQKKSKKSQNELRGIIRNMNEDFVKELSLEELCVICNALFKCSTKINNRFVLKKIRDSLNEDLSILKDPAFFITFVKSIRHNFYQDDDLLSTISCAIFFNKTLQYYDFVQMCHILALYSDYLYYDKNILMFFSEKCISELKESNNISDTIRDKDLERFLWALSNLGYDGIGTDVIKDVIVPNVLERILHGDLRKDPNRMIDIVLYLWMMNYQALEIVPYALTESNVNDIIVSKTKNKDRLNLLLSIMYFENRPLFKDLNMKPRGYWRFDTNVQLHKRPIVKRVLKNLKLLTTNCDINKYEIGCQIPYLNIIGITGYRKKIYKTVLVEVIDNYVSVKNEPNRISGPMQLKLRILDSVEEGLVVVRQEEIEGLTDTELQEYLSKEISLVC